MALEAEDISALRCVLWLSKVYAPRAPLVTDVGADGNPAGEVDAALEILIENEVDVTSMEHFQPEDFSELALSVEIRSVGLPHYAKHTVQTGFLELVEFLLASDVSNVLQHLKQCLDDEMDVETFSHFTNDDFDESGIQLGDRLKIRAELKARGFSTEPTRAAVAATAAVVSSPVSPVRDALPADSVVEERCPARDAIPRSAALPEVPCRQIHPAHSAEGREQLELNVADQRHDVASNSHRGAAEQPRVGAAKLGTASVPTAKRLLGTIERYDKIKRFGFVVSDSLTRDVFIHQADVAQLPPHVDRSQLQGLRVGFEIALREGREVAVNLGLLEQPLTQGIAAPLHDFIQPEGSQPWEEMGVSGSGLDRWSSPVNSSVANTIAVHQSGVETPPAAPSPAVSLLWHGVGSSCTCPLSGHPLVDPVIAPDGVTYERASIEAWLSSGKSLCPADNTVALTKAGLVPNVSMLRLMASTAEALDGLKDAVEANEVQLSKQRSSIHEAERARAQERANQENNLQVAVQQNVTLATVVNRHTATIVARDKELCDLKRTIADLQSQLAHVDSATVAARNAMEEKTAAVAAAEQEQITGGRQDAGVAGGLRPVHPATQQLVSTLDGLLAEASAAQVARATALMKAELQGIGSQRDGAGVDNGEADKARKAAKAARKMEYLDSIRVALQLNADVEVYSHKYSKWLQGTVVSLSGNEAKVEYCGRTKRVNIGDYETVRLATEWVLATGHHVPDMSGGLVLGEGEGILRHIAHS